MGVPYVEHAMAQRTPPLPHRAKGFRNPGDNYIGRSRRPKAKKDHFIPPKPEEEPSLADEFVASTYTFSSVFRGRNRKLAEEALLRYRIDMNKAHRFVLTPEFTAMATRLSFASAAKTLA